MRGSRRGESFRRDISSTTYSTRFSTIPSTFPNSITMIRRTLLLLLAWYGPTASAQEMPADVAAGADHPVVSRYTGSWLVAQEIRNFDAVSVPGGARAADAVALEGRITRLYYFGPAGRSVLEVQRNYEQALEGAGATRRDACATTSCGARPLTSLAQAGAGRQLAEGTLEGWDSKTLVDQWRDAGGVRWWSGTLTRPGTTLHVSVLRAPSGIISLADKHVATVVQIVEPAPMETGKVTVDAAAMAKGLEAEGRIALYGVFFDTGKSELKPESTPQVEEMARLLQSNPALRVHIVGHTDNQGSLDINLALSRARAQAVVDALVGTHGIDAQRLSAAGVASYAPVASNADEAGRAKNRRVELVLQ